MELHRIVVRTAFAFGVLLVLLRTSGKRAIGEGTPFDFVLALLLGDMVDDVLWSDVPASQFATGVTALAIVHAAVAWLSVHSPLFHRLVSGEPLPLVHSGRVNHAARRREHVSAADVEVMLRGRGIPPEAVADVAEARLETDGRLSVLKNPRAREARRWDLLSYPGDERLHLPTEPMPLLKSPTQTLAVLFVDDDENTCEAYAELCRTAGLGARTAHSAEAALAAVRADPPDVIVLDYAMPGMNGIELLNVLRKDPGLRRIPVIMLSGQDRDLRSVHGAPWLRKPVDPPALLEHIRRVRRDPLSEP
jgi:uncharacterized membrane protein YcaP (DUF421 family)/CheY-like chemotaxis protein